MYPKTLESNTTSWSKTVAVVEERCGSTLNRAQSPFRQQLSCLIKEIVVGYKTELEGVLFYNLNKL